MPVTLTRTQPPTGLCIKCANFIRVFNFGNEADNADDEQPTNTRCAAIESLVFGEAGLLTGTEYDEAGSLTAISTTVSGCSKYVPAAFLSIDSVTYDAGVPELVVGVTLECLDGTPDLDFYFFGTQASIHTEAAVTTATTSVTIPLGGTLADGNYYLYAQLSTGEISMIFAFNLTTS
jgi:hypothetical protein